MHTLQKILLPKIAFGCPSEMYVRCLNEGVDVFLETGKLVFTKGGKANFDTFFNGVSLGVWKTKTNVGDLRLTFSGKGKFKVRFGLHRLGQASKWLQEASINLEPGLAASIPVIDWGDLADGMLYFSVAALEDDATLTGGNFSTNSPAVRDIKLGIVITHFNRKRYVIPAIERIKSELLDDPECQKSIELVVVDNSRNLSNEEAPGITLIPNQNLGGAGGFTRGLIHLKDAGGFTHCLFMDDDASCDVDSIRRAIALLKHATDKNSAVSGSLLRELEPYRLMEKGALFENFVVPLKASLDMRRITDLLRAEIEDVVPHYGAWWFLMFPIASVKKYTFPFFVRGDDIYFGLKNRFPVLTLNGIACWGDDFGLKCGPMTAYLDTRNHLAQPLLSGNLGRFGCARLFASLFAAHLFSYNYGSASACLLALQDISKGPKAFTDDITLDKARASIAEWARAEKVAPLDESCYKSVLADDKPLRPAHFQKAASRILEKLKAFEPMDATTGFITDTMFRSSDLSAQKDEAARFFTRQPVGRDSILRRMIRICSLNGFLIPSAFLRRSVVLQPKCFRATLREVFRYQTVLYEYGALRIGYVAQHDKKKFFSTAFSMLWPLFYFVLRFRCIQRAYQKAEPEMTSEEFWRSVFALHDGNQKR